MPLTRLDAALAEWEGKRGHPVCVLEPTRLCIRPKGHKGHHTWVPLEPKKVKPIVKLKPLAAIAFLSMAFHAQAQTNQPQRIYTIDGTAYKLPYLGTNQTWTIVDFTLKSNVAPPVPQQNGDRVVITTVNETHRVAEYERRGFKYSWSNDVYLTEYPERFRINWVPSMGYNDPPLPPSPADNPPQTPMRRP